MGEDWVGCAAAYDALRGLPQSAPKATYGAASCYARAGQTDKAIERLAESAALGLHQAGGLEAEPDLVPLHGQRQWPSLVAHFEENLARYLGSVNRELYDMYQADQGDRAEDYESHWQAVNQRDAQRRVRTRAIVAAGDATAADDWYHAAMIMQHGSEREDFGRAHDCQATWCLATERTAPRDAMPAPQPGDFAAVGDRGRRSNAAGAQTLPVTTTHDEHPPTRLGSP